MTKSHLLIALAFSAAIYALAQSQDKITVLKEPYLEKSRWKNAGFKTPQATGQTFMWAMREGNWKIIGSCFDPPDEIKPTEKEIENLKMSNEAAKGYQALAIRAIEDGVVELKFIVTGWQEKPFVHKMKLINGKWKLDKASSTRTGTW